MLLCKGRLLGVCARGEVGGRMGMAYYILALPMDRTGIVDNCAMGILQ